MDPQNSQNSSEPNTNLASDTSLNSEPSVAPETPSTENSSEPIISPEVSSATADEIAPATSDSPSITPESAAAEAAAGTPFAGQTVSPSNSAAPASSSNSTIGTSPISQTSQPTPPAPTPAVVTGGSKHGKRKLFVVLAVVIIILLAVGYAFAFYLPNTPSRAYSSGLTNTGKALDSLITYTKSQDSASYKSTSLDGTLKYKSGDGSFDTTLNGAFDKDSNGTLQLKADIEGENMTANLRSVKAAGNTSPDLYVQVSGVKAYLDSAGLSDLDSLDGQWISIDHTVLDTYSASLKQELNSTSNSSVADASTVPTTEQINDAIDKVQTVNKQYIFTTDNTKAVLTNDKFIAKETKNGRSTDHFKVGYNKVHLQAYITAVGNALDSSSLNDWSKKANGGKTLSAALNLGKLETTVKNSKGTYNFDMWVDTKTKLVSSLQFTDPSDASSVFTIGQNYTGGTTYPFSFTVADKDENGNPEKGAINLTVNTKTHVYSGDFTVDSQDTSGSISLTANFTLTPGNNDVKVTAPTGAKSINDVLNELGLGGLLDSSAGNPIKDSQSGSSDLFTLTQ